MKRAAVLFGMGMVVPLAAEAQIPVAPPAPPAAAPSPAPAPTPAATADAKPPQPPGADAKAPPGDEYYVEGPPGPSGPGAAEPPMAGPPGESPPFEPPPPEEFPEPPPPPMIQHLAPQMSLWLGARVGWFFPFGNLWAKAKPVSSAAGAGYVLRGVPWSDYASSGPTFELDAGVRVSRSYTAFLLWERAQLGTGNDTTSEGAQDRAESDFWAVGLRASSNADKLGFLTEVAIGYRRARTLFKNDVEYQFTDAPFEARLGLGAELRLSPLTSFSALFTVGVGGFDSVERVAPNGNAVSLTKSLDQGDGHAWATLTVGGHFDVVRWPH